MSGAGGPSHLNSAAALAIKTIMVKVSAAHAARIYPEVNLWVGDALHLTHAVECAGLTVDALGEAFARAMWDRRCWCRRNCNGEFAVIPMRNGGQGPDTGRRFLFSDADDAARFRQHFSSGS